MTDGPGNLREIVLTWPEMIEFKLAGPNLAMRAKLAQFCDW